MAEAVRVTPEEARRRLDSGQAILVCAYENDRKFEEGRLEGAISLHEFKEQLPDLPQSQEIIFYCG